MKKEIMRTRRTRKVNRADSPTASKARAARETQSARLVALRKFARKLLVGYIEDRERIGDIDGKSLEDYALECGLLVERGEGYAAAPWLRR